LLLRRLAVELFLDVDDTVQGGDLGDERVQARLGSGGRLESRNQRCSLESQKEQSEACQYADSYY
jgi:hypothetical protein